MGIRVFVPSGIRRGLAIVRQPIDMSQLPCKYYANTGGCRFGDKCRFTHVGAGNARGPAPVRDDSSSQSSRGGRGQRFSSNSDVPRGVCNFFWSSGECRRGFECRFRHERNPADAESHVAGDTQAPVRDIIAPFLTPDGMARLFQAGTDGHFPVGSTKLRSPSEVHNLLKRFLEDKYRFRTSADVYPFLDLVTCATSTNSSWVSAVNCYNVILLTVHQGPEDGQVIVILCALPSIMC